MTNIICRNLGYSYPGSPIPVFVDLDLVIDDAWRSALVGRNGRGKTTLLRLIHGNLQPESGAIELATPTFLFPGITPAPQTTVLQAVKGAVGPFTLWEQRMSQLLDRGGDDALSEYGDLEATYSRKNGYQIDAWVDRELDAMQVPTRQRGLAFENLSGGEQTRAMLAALFVQPEGYPLVDEPTNHLDLAGRQQVAEYLQSKRGFLLVSHDRHFLDQSVDHVVALNKADATTSTGNYSTWRSDFDAEQQRELARNVTLRKDIKRLTAAAGQRRAGAHKREGEKAAHADLGYIGHRAAKQMQRALNIERRSQREIEERRELLQNYDKERALKLTSEETSTRPLLTVNNLGIDRGHKTLFDDVSFTVTPGDRLAILGGNGSGKTSLLETLCGELPGYRGVLKVSPQLHISRGYQIPLWTHGSLEALLAGAGLDRARFNQIMAVLGVGGEALTKPLEQLSQGQRKKVDLARSFARPGQLFIWDEPLNYLDVESREQITRVILEDQPTLIFVEHDRHFVDAVATTSLSLPA
ncbi:MAG: ATP-binding cassette domain-containing protein [Gammaproteobacteria bacterium]|nr:ATP-binding cassette domain-containing protein [Gammaproteobacteria bacterium]